MHGTRYSVQIKKKNLNYSDRFFIKCSNANIYKYVSSWSGVLRCREIDRQTDVRGESSSCFSQLKKQKWQLREVQKRLLGYYYVWHWAVRRERNAIDSRTSRGRYFGGYINISSEILRCVRRKVVSRSSGKSRITDKILIMYLRPNHKV